MAKKAFYQNNPYLDDWKREMDDESLNPKVLDTLLNYKNRFRRVLDIGTGSGVQIRRNIELGLLRNGAEIIGADINKEGLVNAINSFKKWAQEKHYKITELETDAVHEFAISKGAERYQVRLQDDSVYDLLKKDMGTFDFVSGLSLLEHTEMERALRNIFGVMKKEGLLYLPINYDTHTVFGPTPKERMEKEWAMMRLLNYVAVDNQFKGGVTSGNSQCGSLLPQLCKNQKLEVLAYGASEWVIPPDNTVKWTKNKKHLMNFLVDVFYKILSESGKEMRKFDVSQKDIESWNKLRTSQLSKGTLSFSCMNKDILCRKP